MLNIWARVWMLSKLRYCHVTDSLTIGERLVLLRWVSQTCKQAVLHVTTSALSLRACALNEPSQSDR